jgi:hypothetical protein
VKRSKAAFGVLIVVGLALSWSASSAAQSSPEHHERSKESPLVPPKTTPVQDARYLTDVAKADPGLATYVERQGNVALQAMLTDGTAFCAFLRRGGGIDDALLNVAAGARSVEPQTHLPSGVETFNAIEAVALLDLCPSEQKLVPASVRTKLHQLHIALGGASTSPG